MIDVEIFNTILIIIEMNFTYHRTHRFEVERQFSGFYIHKVVQVSGQSDSRICHPPPSKPVPTGCPPHDPLHSPGVHTCSETAALPSHSVDRLLWTFHRDGVIQCVAFPIWLLWLGTGFQGSATLLCVWAHPSILWMSNSPLQGYASACLFLSVDKHWAFPTFLLLWVMPLWTFMYRFLHGHMFIILLGMYMVCNSWVRW